MRTMGTASRPPFQRLPRCTPARVPCRTSAWAKGAGTFVIPLTLDNGAQLLGQAAAALRGQLCVQPRYLRIRLLRRLQVRKVDVLSTSTLGIHMHILAIISTVANT